MTDNTPLSISDLKQKIEMVEKDLRSLQGSGDIGRKFEVLSEYKEYLEDELKDLIKSSK